MTCSIRTRICLVLFTISLQACLLLAAADPLPQKQQFKRALDDTRPPFALDPTPADLPDNTDTDSIAVDAIRNNGLSDDDGPHRNASPEDQDSSSLNQDPGNPKQNDNPDKNRDEADSKRQLDDDKVDGKAVLKQEHDKLADSSGGEITAMPQSKPAIRKKIPENQIADKFVKNKVEQEDAKRDVKKNVEQDAKRDVKKNIDEDAKRDVIKAPPRPVAERVDDIHPAIDSTELKPDNTIVEENVNHTKDPRSAGRLADADIIAVDDDDDSSSPTVIWFVLFSAVIVVSVIVYLHRSGLRAPSSLPVSGHNHAEEVPLMTSIDHLARTALLNVQVPSSAIDRYLQAFHSQRISRIEQLDDSKWKELALPSAIELELRRRFQEASKTPRSAGLALHRGNFSRSESQNDANVDDTEFDDWSFDDEDINNEI